jgi:murein L,D-transpeptidase YcbB/YkuD
MTNLRAGLTRAGLVPAAAMVMLVGSLVARAEESKAPDKTETPAAAAGVASMTDAVSAKDKANAADSKISEKEDASKETAASDSSKAEGAASAEKSEETASGTAATTSANETAKAEPSAGKDPAGKGAAGEDSGTPPAEAKEANTPAKAPPTSTAALPDATSAPAASVSDQALPPADAIVTEVRHLLPDAAKGSRADDVAALAAYYEELNGPAIWITSSGLTPKGKAVVAEIGKADDWGLRASDFDVPQVADGNLTQAAAAEAEIKVAQAVLRYARYARGGRIDPSRISQLMDQSPTLKAPKAVLTEIAVADAPDAYLRSLHPKHEQFERLRQVLLKLRGSDGKDEEEPDADPALNVKIPPGRLIRGGMEDSQVALLRRRLNVPADDPAKENVYDDKLQAAVRNFQRAKGLRPDALIGNNTRAVLNGRPKPVAVGSNSKIERILINMERWRWVPEDLGEFYVWDNVPEALTRVIKNGKVIHTAKIIVGQPSWPTPIFSADMKFVVFHPSWGVPSGIKRKELLPLLRKSSGGTGLFGIFGGGYSSQAVLDAYQLKVFYNGRQIDPNQVDWNSANIAAYNFQQPPGPKNPLGTVKFMFPNKHDVYMHDTPERHLFTRSPRNFSHGCMRVDDPRRFAEVILGEDKGWSAQKVRGMFDGYSNQVALRTHIPVHITYFTARVDDDGRLYTYADFYGLDSRTAAALTGRPVHFREPSYLDRDEEVASSSEGAPPYSSAPPRQYNRKRQYQGPPTLGDAISDIFSP